MMNKEEALKEARRLLEERGMDTSEMTDIIASLSKWWESLPEEVRAELKEKP